MGYSVFDFRDYRIFLLKAFGDKSQRKGTKSRAAKFIGCHTTLISQILHGQVVPNLEQADKLNQFLEHDEEEGHYLILLVQKARAGTKSLELYFEKQIEQILKNRQILKKRVGKTTSIAAEDELRYYSAWQYAAVHVALSIPALGTIENISKSLKIPSLQVKSILDFLLKTQLAVNERQKYAIGPKHMHLGVDSPQIQNHHINWRVRAIQSIDMDEKNKLHYSSAITLSKSDVEKIKEILIENLKGLNKVIRDSKEEEVYALNFDFFNLSTNI